MAQTSYFWDGTTVGDATLAPYDDAEIASIVEDVTGSFVVPGYLFGASVGGDELHVIPEGAVAGEVTINPGAAMVRGVLYLLTEETTLTIPATVGANPAIHRVILDKDVATQEVRLSVTEGTPAALPEPPAVAANEMTIAWVYVDGAYDDTVDLVAEEDIHDERVFKYIGPDTPHHFYKNILPNNQFMAISGGVNTAPDGWKLVNTPVLSYATSGRVTRGWALRLQGSTGEGIETTVPIYGTAATLYTVRGYVEVDVDSFDVEIYTTTMGGASVLLTTKTFNAMISPRVGINEGITEFLIRVPIDATVYDAITIKILSNTATTDAYTGELALIPGYVGGDHNTVYTTELIMLDAALADASWTATAKSDGITTVDLIANFGSVIKKGLRGIIALVKCRDSGSAGAANNTTAVSIGSHNEALVAACDPTGMVSCTGLANNSWVSGIIYVAIDPGASNPSINITCAASGALTLDVTVEIIGIIT